MKLTESKLKQMIFEALQGSENYEKLKILMTTKEGYIQAESLYEVIRDTFSDEEQMHMDIFFEPLILCRRERQLDQKYKEVYEEYKAKKQASQHEGDNDYIAMQKAFAEMQAMRAQSVKQDRERMQSFNRLKSHLRKYPYPESPPLFFEEIVMETCWEISNPTE